MVTEKRSKTRLVRVVFGCLFAVMGVISSLFAPAMSVYAEPEQTTAVTSTGASCETSLGALGWLVCPSTGKISEAVDWLYGKIENILVINPVKAQDGQPVYEIWKYFRGVTNIVFVVFLLVMIYSQITGVGITNYGIKKALPKLIVAAILVNLSFYICSIAVDASNIFGAGIRGMMETIETSTTGAMNGLNTVATSEMYAALSGGTALAVGGGAIAFEAGAIWMLIPTVLGAIVAVAVGLITIAMRQAVVTLLIMIAPLAMVAYILPNTEQWFKKWKGLLTRMLVFYPAFSLLFGASSLAGWAIIVSAHDGFGVILGVAVQIFPLFFSWSLMKMSGTFLATVNSKLSGLASGALAENRAWADSHRQLTRARQLARGDAYTPTLRLRQFLNDRKVSREEAIKEHSATLQKRGLAYNVRQNYRRDGKTLSREGEETYAEMIRNINYDSEILRHQNNFNAGVGELGRGVAQTARLEELDRQIVQASDTHKIEQARGELVDYRNAKGFHERMENAVNMHMDQKNAGNDKYKMHKILGGFDNREMATRRYSEALKRMNGNVDDVQYAAAAAAHGYDAQNKIHTTKMQKYLEMIPPTKDVVTRLNELSMKPEAISNIDAIVAGMRVLNQRGDTDLVKEQLENVLNQGVELGTHASQALASFLMFDVKDSDPFLRRFGKYINLETARVYNANDRKQLNVTYDEYVRGNHIEPDGTLMYAKKDMKKLMEGTSLDNVERTAFSNLDESLKKAYGYDSNDKAKAWDVEGWMRKREEIQTAVEPAFLSSSLKWLSGSEQIATGVKFWTGYELKQKKVKNPDGTEKLLLDENGDPVYNIEPVWMGKEFAGHEAEVEKYFRRKTADYFKDQTTGQILGMRTDYRDATREHMLKMYLEGLADEKSDDEREEYDKRQAEYNARKAEIQTRYGDKDIKEAEKLRKKDLKALDMEFAGRQVRQILGETGKLKQIYRTRTSGTAINAKDWLRKWVNLDNENELRKEMVKYDRQLAEQYQKEKEMKKKAAEKAQQQNGGDPTADEFDASKIYTVEDSVMYDGEMSKLRDELRDATPEEFYKETREKMREWFAEDELIIWKYDKFYKSNRNADLNDLYGCLKDLLGDMSNYPGYY